VLPHDEDEERTEKQQKAIDKGHAVHKYLEIRPELADDDDTFSVGEIDERFHKYCRKIDIKQAAGYYTPLHYRELAMAYDVETRTARQLAVDDRGYHEAKLKDTEIPGTADVVIPGFRTLEVWDYKTGKWPVPSGTDNAQLMFLALCAQKSVAPQATDIILGIQTLKGFGRIETDPGRADSFDLESFEEHLIATHSNAVEAAQIVKMGDTPRVFEGDHCRFCPARNHCPAKG
jgi:hypothetical protein